MASNHTANFDLNQWAATDQVLRTDFNGDNQKIDAALAALGNCRIATGSYTGTGTVGADSPNTIQTAFKPLILFLNTTHNYPNSDHIVWTRPGVEFTNPTNNNVKYSLTWGERSVQWYNLSSASSYATPAYQLNESGVEYCYTVIGVLE